MVDHYLSLGIASLAFRLDMLDFGRQRADGRAFKGSAFWGNPETSAGPVGGCLFVVVSWTTGGMKTVYQGLNSSWPAHQIYWIGVRNEYWRSSGHVERPIGRRWHQPSSQGQNLGSYYEHGSSFSRSICVLRQGQRRHRRVPPGSYGSKPANRKAHDCCSRNAALGLRGAALASRASPR